jgi:pimeloyl-ACP methyl ester carboxylesterase
MTGPVFLYLHGFASSVGSTKARAFMDWGERHGVALRALDLRVPSFDRLRFSSMEARIREAIDASGGPRARAVLIGSSLGGLAACRVAAADPRVCAVFAMAPAFAIAKTWKERLGPAKWTAWQTTGSLEVDDYATGAKARVHWAFIEELAGIDEEHGCCPDVRVPVHVVHGLRDDVVDIALSRGWASGKPHVRLVEVDDGHELSASIPRVLDEADQFFRAFTA